MFLDASAGGVGEPVGEVRLPAESFHRRHQGRGVPGLHQQSLVLVSQDVRGFSHPGGDNGSAPCCSFEQGHTETLAVGGLNIDVEGRQ